MANEEKITELIDLAKIQAQIDATEKGLQGLIATMEKLAGGFAKTGQGASQAKTYKETSEAQQKYIQTTTELTEAQKKQIDAQTKLASLKKQYKEQIQAEQSAYKSLVLQYEAAAKAAKDLGAAQGTGSKAFKEAAANADMLAEKLKEIDGGVGQFQRNVGNYEKGFKSVRQELRAVTQEIGKLILEGKGLDNPEVKKYAKRLDELKDAMTQVKNSAELADNAGKFSTLVKGLGAVAAGFEVAQGAAALFGDENEEFEKTMRKVAGAIAVANGLEQISNALKKESGVLLGLQLVKQKALTVAQGAYNVVVGTSVGLMKALRIAIAGTGIGLLVLGIIELVKYLGKANDGMKDFDTATKDAAESQKALKDKVKETADALFEADLDAKVATGKMTAAWAAKLRLEREKGEQYTAIISETIKTLSDLEAERKSAIAKLGEEYDLNSEIVKKTVLYNLEKEYADKRTKIEQSYQESINNIRQTATLKNIKLNAEELKEQKETSKEKIEIQKDELREAITTSDAIYALKEHADKLNTKEQRDAAYKMIEALQLLRKYTDAVAESTGKAATKAELLTEKRNEYTEQFLKDIDNDPEMIAELEKIEAIKAAREDLAKQSAASALEIWKNFNESKYADEQNALNKKYKKEEELLKKQLDNKLITQQQYDAKLAQIQKKKDAEELKLKQKKFNDEKIMAVAKIAIETAINVVKASLTPYLIPYIIGLGAAQAAVVLSQPLPKYAKGRKGGEAEWAIVGEEGREAMIADGNVYLTPDKPTLAYLPKGADVIPNRELMRSMINTPSFATNIYESIQLKDSIDRGFINLSQVVKNKKETHIIINEKGLTKIVKNGNNYATYLNNNIVL